MSRKNFPEIHLSPLDRMVQNIPAAERLEIILEYSEFERTGQTGDGALRRRAGEIFQSLEGKPNGFNAAYMAFVALSCHKLNSIEALMNPSHPGVEAGYFDQRERAAVQAGLLLVEGELQRSQFLPLGMSQLLDDGGRVSPLEGAEFSDLCDRIENEPRPLLDPREMAAVRAGLRLVQAELGRSGELPLGMSEILDNGGTLEPLRAADFDELCERIDGLAAPEPEDECPAP